MGEKSTGTIRDWLGFQSAEEAMEHTRVGRVLGWFLSAIALFVVLSAVVLLFVSFAKLFSENDNDAVRNFGLILAAAFTAGFAAWRGVILSKQANTAEQGHITDRYIRAVELLGAEKEQKTVQDQGGGVIQKVESVPNIEVRIGALFTLERIAKESIDDHISIMETICAYIRNNAGINNAGYDRVKGATDAPSEEDAGEKRTEYLKPREDIQTALTILGRRGAERILFEKNHDPDRPYRLDLRETMLAKADLTQAQLGPVLLDGANLTEARLDGANLTGARLNRADLTEARLDGANLTEARLDGANLTGAVLNRADLTKARLDGADLTEARLDGANLTEAVLNRADLTKAVLDGANLTKAWLNRANLTGARLNRANLTKAWLYGADLKSTDLKDWTCARTSFKSVDFRGSYNLTQETVNSAFGVKPGGVGEVLLPEGFEIPAHWHDAAQGGAETPAVLMAYRDAYQTWLAAHPDD